MIDLDKMKAAFAATPLCQRQFVQPSPDGIQPAALCAVSALVAFAGVQPDLLHKMLDGFGNQQAAFVRFVCPVLDAEYGIPYDVAQAIPASFDAEPNEYRAVQKVLAMCEQWNADVAARRLALQAEANAAWAGLSSATGIVTVTEHAASAPKPAPVYLPAATPKPAVSPLDYAKGKQKKRVPLTLAT